MKTVVVILFIAVVALGGSTIHLWRELGASRHQVAELQAQARNTAASARAVAAVPAATVAVAQPGKPATAVKPAVPADTSAQSRAAELRATMASPENLERMKIFFRAQLPGQYPDIGKALGLSPQEVDRLFDLLTKQNTDRERVFNAPQGSDENSPQALARERNGEQDELASLLGGKYQQWKQYNGELPSRRQLQDLGAVLGTGGTPLSDAQVASLIPALTAVEKQNTQDRRTAKPAGKTRFSGR